ncbi:Mu transposase C-terminal domain-containing protein [Streptomyces sp. NPDC093568]|uniref:Mu transposase C-terminal domain-containing protein n=1 Tax=Streptomyces sp. NPDC093568 TaxID=3366041 RepID=UPI003802071E
MRRAGRRTAPTRAARGEGSNQARRRRGIATGCGPCLGRQNCGPTSRKRDYVGPWMTGQAGIQVRVRFMPHHDHRIEVYHAATGRYLGPADLADQATDEQISAVRRGWAARSRRLKEDLEASQRERYATVNQPEAPRRLGALTTARAEAELAQTVDSGLAQLALPDLIPPAAPPADWRIPPSLATRTTPGRPAPVPPGPAPGRPPGSIAQTTEDGDAS